MSRLLRASVAALALAALPALAPAQTRPDFSGRWEVSQSKSSPGAVGNRATVAIASEMIVTQRSSELQVEMRFPRTETPITVVYTFDGSEVVVGGTPDDVTEKARAMWDGNALVITARRVVSTAFGDFVTDTKEVWSTSGDVLTIQKTQSGDGVSDSETAVFERGTTKATDKPTV